MLKINIICVGKIKEVFFRDAILEYSKRLSIFCNCNIIEVPDEKIPDNCSYSVEEQIKEKECLKIIANLKQPCYNIALDLKGKQYDSIQFSKKLEDLSMTHSTLNFIIGGSLGLSNHLLDLCNESICFSRMTFPHQLIRIFLLEQIYRSFKILNNETYHK